MEWLRGGFGRGAGASSTGFRDQMEHLDDVYADERPSGVPPPVHERSHENARLLKGFVKKLIRISATIDIEYWRPAQQLLTIY